MRGGEAGGGELRARRRRARRRPPKGRTGWNCGGGSRLPHVAATGAPAQDVHDLPEPVGAGPSRSTRSRYPTMPWTQGGAPVVSEVRAVAVVVGATDVIGPPVAAGQRRRRGSRRPGAVPTRARRGRGGRPGAPRATARAPTPARRAASPRQSARTAQGPPRSGRRRRSRAAPARGRPGPGRSRAPVTGASLISGTVPRSAQPHLTRRRRRRRGRRRQPVRQQPHG